MVYETIIGTIGAVMVLIAFVLSSLDKIHRNSYKYMAINGTGAAFLIYYSLVTNTIVFLVLNGIWLSVEIFYLIKKLVKK